MLIRRWPRTTAAALLVVAWGFIATVPAASAAQSRECGHISASSLTSLEAAPYGVFTYKYGNCDRATSILRRYLAKLSSVKSCAQDGCRRTVGAWKCHTPLVHGTVAGCVPRSASWNSTKRPFIGVSWMSP
jgi:hypothetical protein